MRLQTQSRCSLFLSAIFLSSAALVFFYPYYLHPCTPLPASTTTALQHLPSTTLPPTFSFTIKLLTFNRIDSLRRCLGSLARADYGGDRVGLHVFVDHLGESTDLVDRKLEESRRVLEFLDGFRWEHGEKIVHYRTRNAGTQGQWLEAWWPVSDDEFAFVVEDDIEVSGLYYRFLKGLIRKYYYDSKNFSPFIYGASLQRALVVLGRHGNKIHLDGKEQLFLYQLVGTWGQLLFPKPWKEFRLWYDNNKSKGIKPILHGMVSNTWYRMKGERIWTPWFIKFIHSRDYYNIYTNFGGGRALSVSHREAGVNYAKSAGPDSSLLKESSLDSIHWELQPLASLKWFDFCFRQTLPERFAGNFDQLESVLNSLQKKEKPILLFSLYRTTERLVKNLLCHLQRLNVQNYIFIGANNGWLHDLARRGHPVIYATEFASGLGRGKLAPFNRSDLELTKEILANAYVVKKCLERGYSTWIIDGNMIPIFDAFAQPPDASHDFIVAKDAEILFARSSLSASNIWSDDFIYNIASAAHSSVRGRPKSIQERYFVQLTASILMEGRFASSINGDDVPNFTMKLGAGTAGLSSGNGSKIVFWSPESELDFVQKELGKAGLWLLDSDSSCHTVYCHGS